MLRGRLSLAVLVLALALVLGAAGAAARVARRPLAPAGAAARVPQGFVGVVADGPLFDPHVDLAHQLDRMVASGVESLRVIFNWAFAQPYQRWADVPPADARKYQNVGGVPTSFAVTDQIVGLAARRGLSVLPLVLYAPAWDAGNTRFGFVHPPRASGPYASFAKALVRRYGPHGVYWREHPGISRLPIRMWEIWNEPNNEFFWPIQPAFANSYLVLLRAAHQAIKSADPGAKVVLGGLPNFAWTDLAKIYKVPGARRLFDAVDVHPYTVYPASVITFLQKVRDVMNRAGDARKPMLAAEMGWPSSLRDTGHYYVFETTEARQASKLRTVLPLLARYRHELGLLGFYYNDWLDDEHPGPPPYSFGLLRLHSGRIIVRPALDAFRHGALVMEACRVKARVATGCLKRA